ncbi:MAG: amidohydrolase family protein [Actinobacteria bacterium]|nr:amidohydrolase family protein [Actinomycetota bacterium]
MKVERGGIVRTVTGQGEPDTRKILANARVQAVERGYSEFPIVDVDAHHYENDSWAELTGYIDDPIVRQLSESSIAKGSGRGTTLIPSQVGNQDVGGRIQRYGLRQDEKGDEGRHRDVSLIRRSMEMMGIDYTIVFPTPMLNLGLHPQPEVEKAIARGYARWMTERVLPEDTSIKTMLYLPFNDPEAALKLVEDFSSKPGVVGFMVTSVRYRPVHDKAYMPVYAALEERGLPLAFHGAHNWYERATEQLNRFISAHALGFPLYNMIHLMNLVINGIPERFPKLKLMFMEGGLAWVPFLMQRLDSEYMMRTSEAPLLTKKPSAYMREFYYSTQPMERPDDLSILEKTFEQLDARNRLVFSSDYPHWDFDLPGVIYDLPFLDEDSKRRILGRNAMELFNLPEPKELLP